MLTTLLRVVFPSYLALVVVLSVAQRGPDLPEGGDKLAHLGAYLLMALLGMPLTTSLRSSAGMFLAIAAIGALLEGVQAIVPTRTASGWDLVANLMGAVVGTLVWLGVAHALRRWPADVES